MGRWVSLNGRPSARGPRASPQRSHRRTDTRSSEAGTWSPRSDCWAGMEKYRSSPAGEEQDYKCWKVRHCRESPCSRDGVDMRKNLIAGNWKMNATHLETIQMVQKLSYRLNHNDYQRVDVVVCPPFTALRSAQTVIESDHLPIGLGAQNVYWEEKGAYTGEIAPGMLAKLSVSYVIVGHSLSLIHISEPTRPY